jgi:hypothetical protein
MKKRKFLDKHSNLQAVLIVMATVVLSATAFLITDQSFLLKMSLIDIPQHAPFDGTVSPVKKVPNWVGIDSARWNVSYSALNPEELIDAPYYEPNNLRISTDDLEWGDASDDVIRNEKITYSVPYMGTYLLDGEENAGSHLAVDLKIPNGTPIFAIANGTVVKASTQSSGFGHHIVIQHNNFPTLDNENVNEVLYSSYSHLSSVLVEVGKIVDKGDQIGLSGSTGTATTPHLHFQLDNDKAPWHPYWPFTWSDVSAAGLNFFSAVNEGLGRDKAISTTLNPMKYVQKYMSYEVAEGEEEVVTVSDNQPPHSYVSHGESETNEVTISEEEVETEVEDSVVALIDETEEEVVVIEAVVEVVEVEEIVEPEVQDPPEFTSIEIIVPKEYKIGHDSGFSVMIKDQYGETFENEFIETATLTADKGVVKPSKVFLTFREFEEGVHVGFLDEMNEGRDRLSIKYGSSEYHSEWFKVAGVADEVSFTDVDDSNKYYDGIMYLASNGLVVGYDDGTFKPKRVVNRAEALKLVLEGVGKNISLGDLPFKDIEKDAWYNKYVYTAYKKEIVGGYDDKTFRPANNVTKAEFYKILLVAMDMEPDEDELENASVWYLPYLEKAHELGVIEEKVSSVNATADMSREEVANAIYRFLTVVE